VALDGACARTVSGTATAGHVVTATRVALNKGVREKGLAHGLGLRWGPVEEKGWEGESGRWVQGKFKLSFRNSKFIQIWFDPTMTFSDSKNLK
jgi:hypothetical protein